MKIDTVTYLLTFDDGYIRLTMLLKIARATEG